MTMYRRWLNAAMIASVLAHGTSAVALNGFEGPGFRIELPDSGAKIRYLRQQKGFNLVTDGVLRLFDSNRESVERAVYRFLQSRGIAGQVRLVPAFDKLVTSRARVMLFDLYVGDIPLCNAKVKASIVDDELSLLSGSFPDFEFAEIPSEWVDPEQEIRELLPANDAVELTKKLQCFFVEDGALVAAWQANTKIDELPFQVTFAAGRMLAAQKLFFDATGTIRAYVKNPTDGVTQDFQADGLVNERLQNSYVLSLPTGVAAAQEADYDFRYTSNETQFSEANAFVHVNQMLSWFFENGYVWDGPRPLQLRIHEVFSQNGISNPNNALYLPTDGTSLPQIKVGDGDGVTLRNLAFDTDVVGHEMSHQVVFEWLRSTTGEAAVIHEGMADLFVFLRTGDTCLGESICPNNSTACYVRNQCLRSGALDLKYGDTAYNAARFHEKGQVISGVFYDLVRNYSVPAASVVDIALGLLKHLNPAGDIANLLDSALQADAELGNQYGCHLVAAAQDRGLTSKLPEGIDQTNCDQIVVRPSPTPTPTATPEVSPSPDASASTEFEKATASATAAPEARASGSAGTGSFCGVIGQKSQYGWLITLVVIGIPLVVTRLRFSTKKI